jgi:hypothetical protein
MMTTSLDNDKIVDFNYNRQTTITEGGVSMTQPKQVKGGTFAPADIELIKNALNYYLRLYLSNDEERQIANLLHRLNRIG